jgi:hypothetical protein
MAECIQRDPVAPLPVLNLSTSAIECIQPDPRSLRSRPAFADPLRGIVINTLPKRTQSAALERVAFSYPYESALICG